MRSVFTSEHDADGDDHATIGIDHSTELRLTVREEIFPSEAEHVSSVPLREEIASRRASQAPRTPRVDRETTHRDVPIDFATSNSSSANWRNIALAIFAVAAIMQAALIAYSVMSRNGTGTRSDGSITVTSEPSGLPVSIDGTVRGRTPLTISAPTGSHHVVVGAADEQRSHEVIVTRRGAALIHVQLPGVIPASLDRQR